MGSYLTLRNELSEETHVLTKQETSLGRSARANQEQQGEESQENCSATWLTILGITVMGLVSRLSLISHCGSGSSLWCMHHPAKKGSSEDAGRLVGLMGWRLLSPTGLS